MFQKIINISSLTVVDKTKNFPINFRLNEALGGYWVVFIICFILNIKNQLNIELMINDNLFFLSPFIYSSLETAFAYKREISIAKLRDV